VEMWRLLDSATTLDAVMNLAMDEAILEARVKRTIPPTFRFWRNKRAVVIGYSQKADAEVDLRLCEKERIQVARRITGGGTVYHDLGNLNYTVVLDADHYLLRGSDIAESYRILCSGLIKGLGTLGLYADFMPLSDVFIGGRKISGSAQSRRRGVVLHHGTLLVDADLTMLTRVLAAHQEGIRVKSTSKWKPVTNLREELGREIDLTELKNALIRGFEGSFGIRLTADKFTSAEKETARDLYRTKYSRKEWNFWK
jgi:lipoate-protein ligase A